MSAHLLTSVAARLATVLGGVTLGDFWSRLDAVWGDRVLVVDGDRPRTASELAADVARWAEALAAVVVPGRPVVIALPNSYEQFLACFAVARAGGLAVPVNDQMTKVEIDHVIADAGAEVVLRSVADLERPPTKSRTAARTTTAIAEPTVDDVAALFYTSGTTGLPKGRRSPTVRSSASCHSARWCRPSSTARCWSPCPSPTSWDSPCSPAWPPPAWR